MIIPSVLQLNLPIFSRSNFDNISPPTTAPVQWIKCFFPNIMQYIIDHLSETENYFPDILLSGIGKVPADVVWMTPTSKSSKGVMDSGVARAPIMLVQWKHLVMSIVKGMPFPWPNNAQMTTTPQPTNATFILEMKIEICMQPGHS